MNPSEEFGEKIRQICEEEGREYETITLSPETMEFLERSGKEVKQYIEKIEKAHRDAANSTLWIGCPLILMN